MKKLFVILLILMMTVIPSVSAANGNVALTEGTTSKGDTIVSLNAGDVTFDASNLQASTSTEINGVPFTPATSSSVGDELVWGTGEKQWFVFDDPTVSMSYQYSGKQLKETIVLKEDKQLSFPVTLGADSKLIPWDNGEWKVVSASSGDTMRGIVITKPFGIDSAGNRIEMDYTYDGSDLNLVYNRTITKYTYANIADKFPTPSYSEIAYPLVIDPTWVSVGGNAYSDTTSIPGYNITMWNVTGTTTFTIPSGVTSIKYLVVAGGGSVGKDYSGGGGAGGVRGSYDVTGGGAVLESALATTPGASLTVSVGDGGAAQVTANNPGNQGSNSVFGTITSTGGGYSGYRSDGGNGGSGGGGGDYKASGSWSGGSASPSGQGYAGGSGDASNIGGITGGGGGAGAVGVGAGSSPSYNVCNGGIGVQSSITGTATYYGGGGGCGTSAANAAFKGTGGLGGGGNGAAYPSVGQAGTNGLGGGAGGGGNGGGKGGSGVVIIIFSTSSPTPIASFTPNGTQTGFGVKSVTYTDTSTGTISDYNWTYQGIAVGNNTLVVFSTAQNVTASFYYGNYSIKHGVNGTVGSNISTQIAWVNVSQLAPVAAFSINTTGGMAPLSVGTTDTSTNTPTSWAWGAKNLTPGNNTWFSIGTNQNQAFVLGAGNWSVNLTATNSVGSNISTQTTWVNATPYVVAPQVYANFTATPLNPAVYASVAFTDTSTGGPPTAWHWDFGDGSTSSVQNPSYAYTTTGLKTVTLTATVLANATNNNTIVKTNYINVTSAPPPAPVASFTGTPTLVLTGMPVQFNDTSINTPTSWSWDFGDSTGSSLQNPSHAYSTLGLKTVSLTATNPQGSNVSTRTNYINVTTVLPAYSGFNRVDLTMSPQYTFALNIVDINGNPIPNVQVLDSNGYNATAPTGVFTYQYPYSVVVFYVTASGYTPASASYVIASNMTETMTLTKVETSTQNANVIFSPRSVAIQVLDANYNPIVNDPVYVNAYSSSLPGGLAGAVGYFKTTYGVAESTAQSMLAANTTYYGTTDDYGFIAIQVADIIQYQVVTHDTTGANVTRLFWPSGPYYQIVTDTAAVAGIAAQGRSQANNNRNSTFNTTYWEPNTTYSCMGINVYDSTGQTNNVYAWWKLVDNGTVWWTNATAIGGYGPINSSKCVLHVPYQQWKWGGITT